MIAGKAFAMWNDGVAFTVAYTDHFVERFHVGERGKARRVPVAMRITEMAVREKIEDAIPEIAAIVREGDSNPSGVIHSKSTSLNVTFETRKSGPNAYTVAMVTTMIAPKMHRKKPTDYEIEVNPILRIHFASPRAVSPVLRQMVAADISVEAPDMEPETEYRIEEGPIRYMAEKRGDEVIVDDATWTEDLWEITVD